MGFDCVKKKHLQGNTSRSFKQECSIEKMYGSFAFINISEGREVVDDDGDSKRNMIEVACLLNLVHRLYKDRLCHKQKFCVCVLSPYIAQVKEIERRLGKSYKNKNFVVKVDLLEGKLSSEANVVIISTVGSNNSFGFSRIILDHLRTNAAVNKARHSLWILGNEKTLAEADSSCGGILSLAKERKCFLNAENDQELAEVVINVKSELDELEDLFNKDSTLFKAAKWQVVFSETFVKSFSKLPSSYSKKIVLKFLVKLAHGWRPKRRTDVVCDSFLRIVKQFKVEGRYIICTNDITKVPGYATQILKVWDILHLEDVPALVKKLDKIYGAYSDTFLAHCKEKCFEGCLEVPMRYNSCDVDRFRSLGNTVSMTNLDSDNGTRSFAENAKVKESLLLMKFYSLSAGVFRQLLSASDGTVLNVPFEVSDEEKEIIFHQSSSFVLGRSGTGKTTVLIMKLFQKEQQHQMASEGLNPIDAVYNRSSCIEPHRCGNNLRQLFVTVNPKLCFAVKQHINNLRRFVHYEDFDEGGIPIDVLVMDEYENFQDLPNSFEEISSNMYPLVLTFNTFLLMLDRTCGSSYFERFADIRSILAIESESSRLFVQAVKRKEVTYEKFKTSYWPHFNVNRTRKLDPSRVFTEIISCIKGGIQCRESDSKLTALSYLHMSNSRVSNFSEGERKMIYEIFEDYEKKKVVRGEYDVADLVNDLHRRLNCEKYGGDLLDFVYVDEVQDLTMKQLSLFKHICNNVEEGFVFAGDTAQTIARGVDFRFEDIRCLFYREFLHGAEKVAQQRMINKGTISPIFHLSQNFRTHSGVVNLAQSVIELIYHFFPNSIDCLNPETSLLSGELPVLLYCDNNEDDIIKIFQDNGSNANNSISFGSDQVFMVRDDFARDKIAKKIGRNALVLTIFDCKGLEFEDVLLYNFFGSSPLKEQWRIIYEYMEKEFSQLKSERYPCFTDPRHNILCYEMKQLYVALTRTRQRLWICENSEGLSFPMIDFWQKLNLIQFRKLDDEFVQAMQVASNSEDWRVRGIKMLEVRNYKVAAQCFERAGDMYLEKFSRASELKTAADHCQGLKWEKSAKMLREAAELFASINNIKKAAECYFDAKDYEIAGELYRGESDF